MAFRDIRKSRKFLSAADVAVILGVLLLTVALLVLNIYLARTFKGGEWLFLRWSGARAFLFERIESYGSVVAQHVQLLVYGREAFLAEYPYALNDPFYILLLYTPLAILKELLSLFSLTFASSVDFEVVRGIWMLFSEAALVGIVLLTLRLLEWKPPRWLLVILIVFGLFNSFSLNALLSASPTIFLTLLYLCILVALRSFADELAGALLFLVAYQWEVGAVFFLFILIFILANRRWHVFVGLGMTLMVLAIISFIANSDWFVPYARAVLFDWSRGTNYSFGFTLSYIFPAISLTVGRWLAIALTILFMFEALRSVNEYFIHVTWVALLALSLNPMMGFAIFPSNHVVLLPAFVLVVALAWERWKNRRTFISIMLLILLFGFSYYIYFQATLTSVRLYSDLLKILPPILATVGLYWMRWWAVRPPRIWADQFGVRK